MHPRICEQADNATRAKFHLEAVAPGVFELIGEEQGDGPWKGTFKQMWTNKEATVAIFPTTVHVVWGDRRIVIDTSDIDVGGRRPVNYYIARREYEKRNAKNPELRYLYKEFAP